MYAYLCKFMRSKYYSNIILDPVPQMIYKFL